MTSQIYFDVTHDGGIPLGRIVFGLFGDDAPKTVQNFREICLKGIDGLSYNGTRFHRIINRFMIQGGDILNGNGTGSISIYGEYFEDENLTINHTSGGFLGMANQGPDTNGCQFYITTIVTGWLDGKHTVFGKVTSGKRENCEKYKKLREEVQSSCLCFLGQEHVHAIERMKTTTDDEPVSTVMISECGEIETEKPFFISDNPFDVWGWVKVERRALEMLLIFSKLIIFLYRRPPFLSPCPSRF